MDLAIIFAIAQGVLKSLQHLRYRNSQLRYQEFPFFLGGKVTGQVTHLPKTFTRMTLNLRFVEEMYSKESGHNGFGYKFFQLYKETKTLESPPTLWNGNLHINWQLPDDLTMSTALNQQHARYWELEIKADTPGIDYHSRFLLPIYVKPSESKLI